MREQQAATLKQSLRLIEQHKRERAREMNEAQSFFHVPFHISLSHRSRTHSGSQKMLKILTEKLSQCPRNSLRPEVDPRENVDPPD